MRFKGIAHVYGDNIDTDRIIPGKYTKTLELESLAEHVLEDLDPDFSQRVIAGDLLVAGSNFGTGSSREQAALAIKAAGISVVVAKSFARIFYRNAINVGLPIAEVHTHNIKNGHVVSVDLDRGLVTDEIDGRTYPTAPMPQVMLDILIKEGLVNYLKEYGDYQIGRNG